MLLLFREQGTWRIPLTLRPPELVNHGGQISFPGGRIEAGESVEEAALRELQEELGIEAAGVRILGRLSPVYVFASNFLVTPCVATVDGVPEFTPCPREVADLITPGLDSLADPGARSLITIERRGLRFVAPCIRHANHCIWGATSMMLAEFLEVAERSA